MELSTPLEQYYSTLNINLDEMQKYLLKKHSFEINEGILALAQLEDLDRLETLWKMLGIKFNNDIKVREYLDALAKLIDGLRKNEEKFYEEVNSTNPNFLLTTYYSLYLRYLTTVYAKLSRMRRVVARTKHSTLHFVNLIVGLLGMPILHYLKTKEVFPYISELSGVLLNALTNEAPIPSKDSLGYYLFSSKK
ncbi:MAG: hypothetical protein OWQ50_05115 [Acidianus infernus]|nr:hypothetical protein [Acidianus infernus]